MSFPGQPQFGITLKQLREARGMNKNQLARELGVTASWLGSAEAGRVRPAGDELIERIAALLDADPDVLFVAAGRVPPDLREQLSSDLNAVKWTRIVLANRDTWDSGEMAAHLSQAWIARGWGKGEEEAQRSHDHRKVTDGADTTR